MNDGALPAAARTQLDPENPWPGLESYEESSQAFFSGRATEIDELTRQVVDEPVTVLFGKSGLGKTSLVKAGLFPRLRDRDFLPVYVRLQIRLDAPPLFDQIRQTLADELRLQRVEHPAFAADESLWEYLHRAGLELWSERNRLVRPVFVFDQFEEVFTLGRAVSREIERFRHELSDFAENRVPPAAAERLEQAPSADASLDVQAMPYKIVVSLREDFLADLEGWRAAMPSLRRNRMRLLPMGPERALEAILNERTSHLVDRAHAEKIVAFLSSGAPGKEHAESRAAGDGAPGPVAGDVTIEPALLSLFCRGVNEQRKRQRKTRFDDALLEGGKETIVADFYRNTLADQPEAARRFIEEQLITEHGFRNSYSVDDALAHGYLDAKALAALVDRRLLRRDYYLGTERVELTHDLLTRAVVGERDRRREVERLERERRQRRRSWIFIGGSVGVALVCMVLAGLAWQQKIHAEEQQRDAEYQKYNAQKSATDLERSIGQLRESQALANKSRDDAIAASKEAEAASKEAATAKDDANAQRSLAESREIAARAQTEMERDPGLSVLLAFEALRRSDSPEARAALLEAARFAWPIAKISGGPDPGSKPAVIALTPDGSRLAVASEEGAVSMWDVTGRKPVPMSKPPSPETSKARTSISTLAFSPDGTRLALGMDKRIQVIDAASGNEVATTDLPGQIRALAYSPDGGTLVYSVDGHGIHLWVSGATPQRVTLRGGEAIPDSIGEIRFGTQSGMLTVVTTVPLEVRRLTRQPDGEWESRPADLSECAKPQSLSAGAGGASASYLSYACVSGGKFVFQKIPTPDRLIRDIVWSSSGRAYVEVLSSPELVVQRPSSDSDSEVRMLSRIKGWQSSGSNRLTSIISVSDDGRRLAAIEGSNRDIRIYTLGESKVFLTELESKNVAVAPDGRWVAIARPAPAAGNGIAEPKETPIDVVVPDGASADAAGGGRSQYKVPGRVTALVATAGVLLVVSTPGPQAGQRVTGVELRTRKTWSRETVQSPRSAPELLGAANEIVWFESPDRGSTFVRASDGGVLLKADPKDSVAISAKRSAVLVCRPRPDARDGCHAQLYAVDGPRLTQQGVVQELRRVERLAVSDDGKYVLNYENSLASIVWQTRESAAAGAVKPVWSSAEHLGASSRTSGMPRMLGARHLGLAYTTSGGEQRAAVYRLGQTGQDPVLVWSVQAKAGTDLGIDMSQTRLLDNGRLLVMRRTGDSNRLEVHRLDSERRAPFTEYENAVVSSPGGTHVVWRYDGKMAGSNRLAVGRLGSKEPLVQFPHDGDPPASFSPDDRWMAIFPDRKNVEFFDLAAGRRFARFEGLETDPWFDGRDVEFPGGNRVARIRKRNDAIVLVPLDPAIIGRFARSLVDRELTREERCRYLPERGSCTAAVKPGGAPIVTGRKTRSNTP